MRGDQEAHGGGIAIIGGQPERSRADHADGHSGQGVEAAGEQRHGAFEAGVGIGSFGQQELHELRHSLLNRGMQRRAAGTVLIDVGSIVDQKFRHFLVAAVDGRQERSGFGVGFEETAGVGVSSDAVGSGFIHIGSSGEQHAGDREIALLDGELKRGETVLGAGFDVGVVFDQYSRDILMIFGDGRASGRSGLAYFSLALTLASWESRSFTTSRFRSARRS